MSNLFRTRKLQLNWVKADFACKRKIALLIPQYNEYSKGDFVDRLRYFRQLSVQFKDYIDVIIIDDGSTDNSLATIQSFIASDEESFSVASVFPNGNKVGALSAVSEAIVHDFIVLSDFDTDLSGLKELICRIGDSTSDDFEMGYYFRMLPFGGKGPIFQFQQLEYCFARILYKFHEKDKSVPVMPGAGCCFRRDVLNAIYRTHSGLRNGEDREATLIGFRMGYSVSYLDNVLALTRPPMTYRNLVVQRIRWNLGYLETLLFERKYYVSQIFKLSRMGVRTLYDICCVLFVVLLPLLLAFLFVGSKYSVLVILAAYLLFLVWSFFLIRISPRESAEFKNKIIETVLLYPIIVVAVDYVAWIGALLRFAKRNYSQLKRN